MYESTMTFLKNWHGRHSERQKLQHAYIVLSAAIVLIAGIASLFNADLGHSIVKLALVALGAFALNAVCWSLLQSWLLLRLGRKPVVKTIGKATDKPKLT